jgi:FkbM family methyltransferase
MRNPTGKALAVLRFLRQKGPESDIPKRWLLQTGGRLDPRFARENPVQVTPFGEYNQVIIQGQTFLWPANADVKGIVQLASELLTPHHPHQYIFGKTKLAPNDVVLDIGACEGGFAAIATNRVRRVIVVEPSIVMCDLIRKLFALRGEKSPVIVNCLLGSEPSVAHFEDNAGNPGASRISSQATHASYPVPVRTLDDLVEEFDEKPTFIKCDAEGAEYSILSGGQNFLRTSRPKLAITTYHNDRDYADMYHLLKSLGYNVEGKGFCGNTGVIRAQMIHAW